MGEWNHLENVQDAHALTDALTGKALWLNTIRVVDFEVWSGYSSGTRSRRNTFNG